MTSMADTEPDLRILQANERTLLAWLRTGLTLMAFGFVIARLTTWLQLEHPERRERALPAWLGVIVVALGTACHIMGALRFVSARRAILAGHSPKPGVAGPVAIAITVTGVGLAAIVYLATSAS